MSKSMRQDIQDVKTTLAEHSRTLAMHSELLTSHSTMLRNLMVEQARARGDIEWLKENTVTRGEHKAGIDLLLGRFDALAGRLDDSRYKEAKNLNRLDEHERRIRALETKPS